MHEGNGLSQRRIYMDLRGEAIGVRATDIDPKTGLRYKKRPNFSDPTFSPFETMATAVSDRRQKLPATPRGQLPPRMRVLFITGLHRTGGWLAEALAHDSASEVLLDEAQGMSQGLSKLRDEAYDAVLVSHEGEQLDALDVLDAIRAGSRDEQAIVVLGEQREQEMTALCYESGADAYACVNTTTTRTLIWVVALAIERHELLGENRRLQHAQRHRLQMEHDEASRLLQQQRAMIATLEEIRHADADSSSTTTAGKMASRPNLPDALIHHYREMLRAYVIMGSGNLSLEMRSLAELLVAATITPQQAMLLHLFVLEEMLSGLGNRSARHVMTRADLLILEVMIHLTEGYRDRLLASIHPPRQQLLPGF